MTDRHNGNGSRRPDEILAEIHRTRAEMDGTLQEIEERLTPGQLVDQGLDYMKHSGAREYFANLGTSAKTNPMPLALAAIGIGWMMATSSRQQGAGTGAPRVYEAKEAIGEKLDAAKSTLASAKDSMGSTLQSAREKAHHLGYSARDTVQRNTERVRTNWDYMLREHPLALGAVGLAIGAVAAAMAPRTEREDEIMGEARDKLMDRAKEAGSEKLEKIQETAAEKSGPKSASSASKPPESPQPASTLPPPPFTETIGKPGTTTTSATSGPRRTP